jgi:hypothetical protein
MLFQPASFVIKLKAKQTDVFEVDSPKTPPVFGVISTIALPCFY